MSDGLHPMTQAALRGTDTNTLLRIYDAARSVIDNSPRPRERERVDKIVLRIKKELQRRKVPQ
jgi:hypothetical protein